MACALNGLPSLSGVPDDLQILKALKLKKKKKVQFKAGLCTHVGQQQMLQQLLIASEELDADQVSESK